MTAIIGFEITNLSSLRCSYRLLAVEGLPAGEDFDKQINRVAVGVTRELRQPVALVRHGGVACIAVPLEAPNPTMTWPMTPHVAELRVLPEEHQLDLTRLDEQTLPIALRFLSWALDKPFFEDKMSWKDGSSFFYKEPLAVRANDVHLFQGVRPRVIAVEAKGTAPRLVWVADVCYRYTDALWLPERLRREGKTLKDVKMSHCLYHYGDSWFRMQIFNDVHRSIQAQKFSPPSSAEPVDVYAYTKANNRNCNKPWITGLDPDSPAFVYRYPNKPDDRYGAAALCKLFLKTSDPAVKGLHSNAIMPPEERLHVIQQVKAKYLSQAKLGGAPIELASRPFEAPQRVYRVPNLMFGGDKELRWKENGQGEVPVRDLGRARMEMLSARPGGTYVQDAFDSQCLLVPRSWPQALETSFKNRFCQAISEFHDGSYTMKTVVYEDRQPTLQGQVEAIRKALTSARSSGGYVLLILPEHADNRLHDHVKRTLWPDFQFQCASAGSIRRFYIVQGDKGTPQWNIAPGQGGKFSSYLRYLSLGMLLVNRQWPFMLADPPAYDIYVGVDVLNHMAGLTFFNGKARDCHFHHFESQQAEKLTKRQMEKEFQAQLPLLKQVREARSLVVLRDGRSFPGERKGVATAIKQLQAEGVLRPDLIVGTVEVHKTSAIPLRLMEWRGKFDNPDMGAAFALNERESFLCMTGFPFKINGTVNPLHLKVVEGPLDLAGVESDVFAQGCLAWTAPDRPSRIPMPIRICDLFLRPIAGGVDEEDSDEDEDEEDD